LPLRKLITFLNLTLGLGGKELKQESLKIGKGKP